MQNHTVDLNNYNTTTNLVSGMEVMLTVKNFNLQSIRKRYLKSRTETSGKIGSVERREVGEGGMVKVAFLENGSIKSEVIKSLKEPRAIAKKGDLLVIGSENKVIIYEGNQEYYLENPWFSYIHTVDFNPINPDLILISSSGFDCFFEYNWKTGVKIREWFAWENGLNVGYDKETNQDIILTRNINDVEDLIATNTNYLLIDNPLTQSLPTAKRAAFINSSYYHPHDENKIIITLFHKGEVREIDWITGTSKTIFSNLKSPHGGRFFGGKYMVTNTAVGDLQFIENNKLINYNFENLPGKDEQVANLEWLQNSICLKDDCWITIDSNRTAFVVFDTKKQLKQLIPYDNNWAVQDLVRL